MNPGLSPIFIDPNSNLTNVPPPGDDPGWQLYYHVNENPVTASR